MNRVVTCDFSRFDEVLTKTKHQATHHTTLVFDNNKQQPYMTITETTYTVAPSAPSDPGTDYPIVGAVPIHDEPRQQKQSTPPPTIVSARPARSTTTTTVTHVPATSSQTTPTTSYPPPGVADGGTWGSIKHSGGGTWALCAVISIVGCMVTLFPCGVFAFCCPCDEKDAYLVNHKLYDHNGRYLGKVNNFDFRRR